MSQVIVESDYGRSLLAWKHRNFSGLKWRDEMKGYATKTFEITPSEPNGAHWCHFESVVAYIKGYWRFMHRSPYPLVDKVSKFSDLDYLRYIASRGYAEDPNYLKKIIHRRKEAIGWLGGVVFEGGETQPGPVSPPTGYDKPKTTYIAPKRVVSGVAKWAKGRRRKIDTIVMHYTYSATDKSAIDTLTTGKRQASAHFLVKKKGGIVEMVKESDTAYHAPGVNSRAIGIENTAMPKQLLTTAQTRDVVSLIRYLLKKYNLSYKAITNHKFVPYATSCPGHIFTISGDSSKKGHGLAEFKAWRDKHFKKDFPAKSGDWERIKI